MTPELALYRSPGSCGRVTFIALEETGTPYDLRVLNRFAGDQRSAAFKAINPKGKVPTLTEVWMKRRRR